MATAPTRSTYSLVTIGRRPAGLDCHGVVHHHHTAFYDAEYLKGIIGKRSSSGYIIRKETLL